MQRRRAWGMGDWAWGIGHGGLGMGQGFANLKVGSRLRQPKGRGMGHGESLL
ncbi:hypothetical protein [Microcoleus sp. FACHB-68]|uniref:hypothetical protein n=1 Tax=Microcoleus sp. FACHB-68 TaxID=2692826 RepID=UPI0016875E38|nr:hypothetical protein [Microcoleus sp. FACHB-68]